MLKKINNDILNFLLFFVCFFMAFYSKQDLELSLELVVPESIKTHQIGEIFYSYKSSNIVFTGDRHIIFPYDNLPNSTFTIRAKLPNALALDKIRFDPLTDSGQITIKNIYLKTRFQKKKVDIEKLYKQGSISAMHSIGNLQLVNKQIIIEADGVDPYLFLFDEIQTYIEVEQIWLENAALSSFLAFLAMILLFCYRFVVSRKTLQTSLPKKLLFFDIKQPQRTLLFSLILLTLSVIATKTFTSLSAYFRFKRDLSLVDYVFTYTADMGIAVLLSALAILIALLSQLFASKKFKNSITFIVEVFFTQFKNVLNIALLGISVALISLAIFYFVSAYVFYEWGGFVEFQHMEMAGHAEVDSEFIDLVFQWKTLFFTLGFFSLLFITAKIISSINQPSLLKTIRLLIIIFLPLALLAWYPLNSHKFKPSVQSPVLMMQKRSNSYQLPTKFLKLIDTDNFKLPAPKEVAKQYTKYNAVAKGMNLIVVMMESVRKRNVDLYGYKRKTMPTLTALAKNSLVFHNAYVNQPRSSKTMESFSLGIYPDPRLPALSWKYKEIKTTDSLFTRFTDQGYQFYYGTMQKTKDTEDFYQYLSKISGDHLDYITDLTDIYKTKPQVDDFPKESLLSEDLLKWSEKQKQPYIAFMWTQCAHMPYNSPITPFGTETKIDKYDNCLANLDDGIDVLVKGLKAQGKLDNTVIMIAGDHGEALGEHLDWGHGNYLYEHSLRYPVVFYNPKIFSEQVDLKQRFQFKDLPATLLYLFGLPDPNTLGQSTNIFTKTSNDPIYLSNVYLDYKLGLIFDHFKFVYRPLYNVTYLYDLDNDPQENTNIIEIKTSEEVEILKRKVLEWYKYQIKYINTKVL